MIVAMTQFPILLLGFFRGVCLSALICLPNFVTAATLDVAETFIDAFYSFHPETLSAVTTPGMDADNALYYQAWAKAAHYQIQNRRPCTSSEVGKAECRITVTDDFGTTLGYTATDTFFLTIADSKVAKVTFEGDDPLIFYAVYVWIMIKQPEVLSGPCKDMFEGGDTPAECAVAISDAAHEFMNWWD